MQQYLKRIQKQLTGLIILNKMIYCGIAAVTSFFSYMQHQKNDVLKFDTIDQVIIILDKNIEINDLTI